MEDHPPIFNYLGKDMMQQHLVNFTQSIQSCFEPGSLQYQKLAKYSEKIIQKREKWPEKSIKLGKTAKCLSIHETGWLAEFIL